MATKKKHGRSDLVKKLASEVLSNGVDETSHRFNADLPELHVLEDLLEELGSPFTDDAEALRRPTGSASLDNDAVDFSTKLLVLKRLVGETVPRPRKGLGKHRFSVGDFVEVPGRYPELWRVINVSAGDEGLFYELGPTNDSSSLQPIVVPASHVRLGSIEWIGKLHDWVFQNDPLFRPSQYGYDSSVKARARTLKPRKPL